MASIPVVIAAEGQPSAAAEDPRRPALAIVPRPLYEIEEELAALLDTEALVGPDQEAEYEQRLAAGLREAEDKRDRVAHFLAYLEAQAALAKAEAARLKARQAHYEATLERVEGYVSRVIESLGLDAKGKRKRLVGKTTTMSLRGCDKRCEVTDAAAIPAEYRRAIVTMPAELWETICDSLEFDLRDSVMAAVKLSNDIDTAAAKAALKAKIDVPGARLAGGTYLVRE